MSRDQNNGCENAGFILELALIASVGTTAVGGIAACIYSSAATHAIAAGAAADAAAKAAIACKVTEIGAGVTGGLFACFGVVACCEAAQNRRAEADVYVRPSLAADPLITITPRRMS